METRSKDIISDARLALFKQPGHVLHIIYKQGDLVHEDHPDCWCQPELAHRDPDIDNSVWIHRMRQ